MLTTSRPVTPINDGGSNGDAVTRTSAATIQDPSPPCVACFVLPAKQAETLMSILQDFMSSAERIVPAHFPTFATGPTQDSTAVWLLHPEAAKCLGISTATLYRYAEQGKIEFRKIGNRLEYRRSALDQFKEHHVHPPRRPRRQEV